MIGVSPIGVVGAINVIGGIVLLWYPEASGTTVTAGLAMLGASPRADGILIFTVGLLALVGKSAGQKLIQWFSAPQQVILTVQLLGVLVTLWHGAYPNGHVPLPTWAGSFAFILWDQLALITIYALHTFDFIFGRRIAHSHREYQEKIFIERLDRIEAERVVNSIMDGSRVCQTLNQLEFEEPDVRVS